MTKEDQFIKFFQEAAEDRKQYRRDVVAMFKEYGEGLKVLAEFCKTANKNQS